MTLPAFRISAVAIAGFGLLDPACVVDRQRPVPVSVRIVESATLDYAGADGVTRRERAASIRNRFTGKRRGVADISDVRSPGAIVLIGDRLPDALPLEDVPVSTVSLPAGVSPNVRLVRIEEPRPAALRQAVTIAAEFESVGFNGTTTMFALSDRGVDVATIEHRWTKDRERFRARLRYAPPSAGLHVVSVGAMPLGGETTAADNAADVALLVDARPLRVLAYEPRPSWNATFVRRALEADARFDVASLVRSSRGVLVRSGAAPAGVAAGRLDEFDVILVGAPEELRAAELDALSRFASKRGGGVVFLPDRRPSGPYAGFLPVRRFDEALLENPATLISEASNVMRASELLIAHGTTAPVATVAAIERSGARALVSFTWSHGAGRMVLWGALDAWRFRADGGGAFARFWQAATADLALAAPPRIDVSVSQRIAAIGEQVTIRATVRTTEFVMERDRMAIPSVGATLVSSSGAEQWVRLWPTAEPGVFEGGATAHAAGSYDVRVTAGRHVGGTPLAVTASPRRVSAEDTAAMALVSRSTGGVAAEAGDLTALEDHLRGLAAVRESVTVRPLRSVWWVVLFATCLCAEWALRRRRGLR